LSSPPLLTIVIVTWNARDVLLDCLHSIYSTCDGLDFDVVVVDNASTDGTSEAVETRFPQVRLIVSERNLGFARGNNLALEGCGSKYALLLNADTRVCDGAIGSLVEFMEEHPRAGAAGAQLLNEDGSRQNSIANFPSLATELLNKSLLKLLFPRRYPSKHFPSGEPIEVDSVIGACMMVRLEAFRDVGGLDERFFFFLEETDFCFRLKEKGWEVWHVPDARVYHIGGHSARKKSRAAARVEYYRSLYEFFRKNRSPSEYYLLRALCPLKIALEFIFNFLGWAMTGGVARNLLEKASVYRYLLSWHLRGCPRGEGLSEK